MANLLSKSDEFWARQATLSELAKAVAELDELGEEEAELLDAVYMARTARLIERNRPETQQEAFELADHLETVAHDSKRAHLDGLSRRYHTRWRMLAELAIGVADRVDVPPELIGRKHVKEILRAVWEAGGRLGQSKLGMIANLGQRSVTLKLMEQWDLIERVKAPRNERVVVLTDLGQLALGERSMSPAALEAAVAPAEPVGFQPSLKGMMYRAPQA